MNIVKSILIGLAGVGLSVTALAADAPVTADVLSDLHHANQKEIAMGKMAEKDGTAKDVKAFGRTLVRDHTAADKKVTALAKTEGVDLAPAGSTEDDMMNVAAGPGFDAQFGKAMLDDHQRDVAKVTAARDGTKDEKLRKLLTDIVPTLEKHQEMAQKIVDEQSK